MHPLVERIVERRGIKEAEAFMSPSYHDRPSPYLMSGMDGAVTRIISAIRAGEKIAVWHDYDCDGIPGGAVLSDFFSSIGHPALMHVPERNEGYGLNSMGISKLKEEGVSLIITVDCGITDIEEVDFANTEGVDIIITDHHLPGPALPQALAIVNAHQIDDEYPFKELCGTGVAFKLVEALIERGNFELPSGSEKWLLDLVALATVADMVPMTGENRVLTKFGLLVIGKSRRPGIKALLELAKVPANRVTEDDLAFSVAPKINAASRMSSPKLAFELLTTKSYERARLLAKQLEKLNQARKLEGMRIAKDVKKRVDALPLISDIIVLGHTTWRPSLLGIAATAVVETHGRSVCLWGEDGGLIKGSCRSDGSVNIVELMREAEHVFEDFGGHELSGGFSVARESVHLLEDALGRALQKVERSDKSLLKREPDGLLTIAEVNESAYEALRALAPFGEAHPRPLFRLTSVRVEKMFRFGAHKEHARLVLSDDSGRTVDAISFFVNRNPWVGTIDLLSQGDIVSIDGTLERSFFMGRNELRLRIENVLA